MPPAVDARDRARVRELKHDLAALAASDMPTLDWAVPRLHALLDCATTVSYRPVRAPDGWALGELAHAGWSTESAALYERLALRTNAFPALYNPLRPAPTQRNRVHRLSSTDWRRDHASVRIVEDVWARVGLGGCDQLRALVCEGPFLVAWVGGFRPGGFSVREEHLLRALLPAMRRAVLLNRKLRSAGIATRGLEAALEAIAAPAFVIDDVGGVDHANSCGRALLARLGHAFGPAARGWLRGAQPGATITRLETRGLPARHLVVLFGTQDEVLERATRFSGTWGLTRRQTDVLMGVVRGNSNKIISAQLGVSEATIEIHVTALLRATRTENRSSLIALFWHRP